MTYSSNNTSYTADFQCIKLFFLFLFFTGSNFTLSSQIVNLPCQTQADATPGQDRKAFGGPYSEGYLHNLTLPDAVNNPCKAISSVNIIVTITSVDESGLPPDCLPFGGIYYFNYSLDCPDFTVGTCPDPANYFSSNNGAPVTQNNTYTNPPVDFQMGENLGIDIVPVMNTGCSVGTTAISSGAISLEYEICVTVTLVDVALDPPIELGPNITICPNGSTTIDATGSYVDYSWNPNGEISQSITVNDAGTYEVTVTDANGCMGTDNVVVDLHPDPTITFDPVAPVVCDNGNINVSVNESYTSYAWSNFMTGQTVNLSTGMYTVTVTDNNNCTAVGMIEVTSVPPPNAGMDGNTLLACNNNSTFNVQSLLGTSDLGGNWTDNDGSGIDLNLNSTSVSFNGATAGTYTFTYTVTGTPPCMDDMATVTVVVGQENDAGTSNTQEFCVNPGVLDFYSLLGTSQTNGNWTDDDGSGVNLSDPSNVDFSTIGTGSYEFTYNLAFDAACPAASATLIIQIDESANAGFDDAISVCEGAIVDLLTLLDINATSGGTFIDTDGSGALTGSEVNTSGLAGLTFDYTYQVGTVGGPCGADEAIFSITVETSLTAGTGDTESLCTNSDVDLFDILVGEDVGGTFEDLSLSGGLNGSIVSPSTTGPGTFTYRYTIGDNITCPESSADITLTFFEEPTLEILTSDLSLCENDCSDVVFNLDGESPLSFQLTLSENNGPLLTSLPINVSGNTYTLTVCNMGTTNVIQNDSLFLPTNEQFVIEIPEVIGGQCTVFLQNPDNLININTNSQILNEIDSMVCGLDTLILEGIVFTNDDPSYSETIPGLDCDSTVMINVTFGVNDTTLFEPTICIGDSILIDTIFYSQANANEEIVLTNEAGCDSLLVIDVSFFPATDTLLDLSLCFGDSIVVNGTTYNESNLTGMEPLTSMNGCDSVVTIDLSFDSGVMISITDTLCPNGMIEVGGTIYDISNSTDQFTLTGASCDTTVTIDLSFHPPASGSLVGTFCANFSEVINGTTYDITNRIGTETIPLSSTNGCDSTVMIDLSFFPADTSLFVSTICENDSVEVNGTFYTVDNTPAYGVLPGSTINGCDSIIEIIIDNHPPAMSFFTPSICANDSIEVNGTVYNSTNMTGTETIPLSTVNGCDSIVEVSLFILDTYAFDLQETLCMGDSLFLAGAWQFNAGEYIDTLQTTDLCDSIVSTMVTIVPCQVMATPTITNNVCALDSTGTYELILQSMLEVPFVVSLEGQNGFSDNINMTATTDPILFENLPSDVYTLSIFDRFGLLIYQDIQTIIDETNAISGTWNVLNEIDCAGETGSIEFSPSGGTGSYDFTWDPASANMSSIMDIVSGMYALTITDQNNCTFDTTFVLTEPEEFTAEVLTTDPSCDAATNGGLEIMILSGVEIPFTFIVNGDTLPNNRLNDLAPGNYDIVVVDNNDCILNFNEDLVGMQTPLLVTYTDMYPILEGDTIQFTGNIIGQTLDYTWSDPSNTLSCTDCPFPVATPPTTTTYSLEIVDEAGCSQVVMITVSVAPVITQIEDIFPNIFTPNGDNTNDEAVFQIRDENIVSFSLSLYDRWGNKVHQAISENNIIRWDGRSNGVSLSDGVYVYAMTTIDLEGNANTTLGDICINK